MIYFAQADSIGHIKIGYHGGVNAVDRLAELQTGCPTKLMLLGTIPGGPETEADLHRQFAFAHLHGEWFKPVPELLAFIGKQIPDPRQGPADVQNRFVQIKVLTVNGRSFTQAMFNQLPEEHIVQWCDAVPDKSLPLREEAIPWGRILHGCKVQGSFHLVWQCAAELRRCLIGRTAPVPLTTEGIEIDHQYHEYTGLKADRLNRVSNSYASVWSALYRSLFALDQLFIGV